jgi:hypothetical protein
MFTPSKNSFLAASAFGLLAVQCQAMAFKNTTQVSSLTPSTTAASVTASQTAAVLNATVLDCFLQLPNDPLSAAGLSTPFLLKAPCSQAVGTQQAFAEAAIYDPATGAISIYHPLVSNEGTAPAAPPVVPTLPAGAVVGLWFGFNGGVLQLLDVNGLDANNSPVLKGVDCVNGLPGVQGDVFGQVSWCNAQAWFAAANTGIASGLTVIPPLGNDKLGNPCPTSRSFEIVDACPSDNVPTQYILVGEATAQDTAANQKAFTNGTVINNASDEALLTNIVDPLIGCTPYLAPSLDNPGAMVPALVLSELQASAKQAAPIGLVPLNDPDTLLTASGTVSTQKTDAYRLGVNQPVLSANASGALIPYCQDMVSVAPPFLKGFETIFTAATTPDACVGNNLFTFLSERYLMSLMQLTCPPSAIPFQPVVCQLDGNGAATSCTITLSNSTTASTSSVATSVKATSVASSATSLAVKIANSTTSVASVSSSSSTSLAVKVLTTPTLSTTALATTTPTKSTTALTVATTSTSTIIIEVITFFIFTLSLGGAPPGVSGSVGSFIVLEEVFEVLPAAASAACTHQFNACAALAGQAFAGTDCLSQMNQCQGVASTASPTASTPGTVTATATVPASASASVVSAASVANVVATGGSVAGNCPAQQTVTLSQYTGTTTVTVTAVSGVASPTLAARNEHVRRHLGARALGKY